MFTHAWSRCRQAWKKRGGKLASAQIITCVYTYAVAEHRWSMGKMRSTTRHQIFPLCFETAHSQTYFCPHRHDRSTQSALPSICLCVKKPAVVQREYQNPPVSATQPFCACVNASLLCMNFGIWLHFNIYAGHFCQIVSLGFKPWMHLKRIVGVISHKLSFKNMRLVLRFLRSFWNLAGIYLTDHHISKRFSVFLLKISLVWHNLTMGNFS